MVVISVMVLNMMRLSATGALRDQDPFANVALGWIILLIAILLLIQSRRSKNKLLMKAGCADMASLPKALMLTQMAESLKLRYKQCTSLQFAWSGVVWRASA